MTIAKCGGRPPAHPCNLTHTPPPERERASHVRILLQRLMQRRRRRRGEAGRRRG